MMAKLLTNREMELFRVAMSCHSEVMDISTAIEIAGQLSFDIDEDGLIEIHHTWKCARAQGVVDG